jgi:hypothetical protein
MKLRAHMRRRPKMNSKAKQTHLRNELTNFFDEVRRKVPVGK